MKAKRLIIVVRADTEGGRSVSCCLRGGAAQLSVMLRGNNGC